VDEGLSPHGEDHLLEPAPRTKEDELWASLLFDLQGQMDRSTFNLWLKSSRLLQIEQADKGPTHLVAAVCSPQAVDWLEHRLMPVIQRAVRYRLGRDVRITFQPPPESG
jgi:chromosomal replication initiation ATPase DnaA